MNGSPAQDNARAAAPGGAGPARDSEPGFERRPGATLTHASHRLVIALHRAGQPIPTIARRFPHVLNRITARWNTPMEVVDLVDDLLVDRRGGRRGFPADALAELLTLRTTAMHRAIAKLRAQRN